MLKVVVVLAVLLAAVSSVRSARHHSSHHQGTNSQVVVTLNRGRKNEGGFEFSGYQKSNVDEKTIWKKANIAQSKNIQFINQFRGNGTRNSNAVLQTLLQSSIKQGSAEYNFNPMKALFGQQVAVGVRRQSHQSVRKHLRGNTRHRTFRARFAVKSNAISTGRKGLKAVHRNLPVNKLSVKKFRVHRKGARHYGGQASHQINTKVARNENKNFNFESRWKTNKKIATLWKNDKIGNIKNIRKEGKIVAKSLKTKKFMHVQKTKIMAKGGGVQKHQ